MKTIHRGLIRSSGGGHYEAFSLFEFFCGTPSSFLTVVEWWWWWWVAYSILVSAQGPLVLGLGLKGLGPGLDNNVTEGSDRR